MLFAVIGTIMLFIFVAVTTILFNNYNLFSGTNGEVINFTINEILMYSAVISCSDAVASLTFIKENEQPKLFSILFGEGVVNDAVAIAIFYIIRKFTTSDESISIKLEFSVSTPFSMSLDFVLLLVYSFILGAIIAMASSYFMKKLYPCKLNKVVESAIIMIFCYLSYVIPEQLQLSPIITLLFSGVIMSHYTFWNLSTSGQEGSSLVSKTICFIAEGFLFVYVGITFIFYYHKGWSLSFILIQSFIIILGRFFAVYALSFVMEFFKYNWFKLNSADKGIMAYSGSIRGAIAFGLAHSIENDNPLHRDILITSTLTLVFFTTIVFGAFMPIVINKCYQWSGITEKQEPLVKNENVSESLFNKIFEHPNLQEEYIFLFRSTPWSKETDQDVLNQRFSYKFYLWWTNIDENYLQPLLIHRPEDKLNTMQRLRSNLINYTDSPNKKQVEMDDLKTAVKDIEL